MVVQENSIEVVAGAEVGQERIGQLQVKIYMPLGQVLIMINRSTKNLHLAMVLIVLKTKVRKNFAKLLVYLKKQVKIRRLSTRFEQLHLMEALR